jgi:hypothetical protein
LKSPGLESLPGNQMTNGFNINGKWKKVKKNLAFLLIYQLTFDEKIVYLIVKI